MAGRRNTTEDVVRRREPWFDRMRDGLRKPAPRERNRYQTRPIPEDAPDTPGEWQPEPPPAQHPDRTAASAGRRDALRSALSAILGLLGVWLMFEGIAAVVASVVVLAATGLLVVLVLKGSAARPAPPAARTKPLAATPRRAFRYPLWTLPLQAVAGAVLGTLLLLLFLFLKG